MHPTEDFAKGLPAQMPIFFVTSYLSGENTALTLSTAQPFTDVVEP